MITPKDTNNTDSDFFFRASESIFIKLKNTLTCKILSHKRQISLIKWREEGELPGNNDGGFCKRHFPRVNESVGEFPHRGVLIEDRTTSQQNQAAVRNKGETIKTYMQIATITTFPDPSRNIALRPDRGFVDEGKNKGTFSQSLI